MDKLTLFKKFGTEIALQQKKLFMRNLYVLFFVLITFLTVNAQTYKVNYDNTSKWFLGLNAGGTWHSTDVKYQLGGGWGITLGKSYNYNYGRFLSFDLYGRYLNGSWYGQNSDTTDLSNLVGNNPLSVYQNKIGYNYHNFKSKLQ